MDPTTLNNGKLDFSPAVEVARTPKYGYIWASGFSHSAKEAAVVDSVQLFKTLADETRLRILNLLRHRELCVCQIVDILKLGQSRVSRHLAHLRNAHLVSDRRDGLWMYYSLAEPEGSLHEQVVGWLKRSGCELPMAAKDLEALASLGECGALCTDHSEDKEGKQNKTAVAVGV